jgi:nicotinate phosphoribosyltransferase
VNARDFADDLRRSRAEFSPPVRSLMDVDFYKFTMGQFILRHYRGTDVTFELILRDKTIPIADLVRETELRACLDYIQAQQFSRTDLYYLRGMDLYDKHLFGEDFLAFLRTFRLPAYALSTENGAFKLRFTGAWEHATFWETIALAVISELYYRAVLAELPKHVLENVYRRAQSRVYDKLEKLQGFPNVRFADFGQRRRHSFLWQQWVLGLCKVMMGEQFTGTSNTWMAFHHNLVPIGTNAHELPMVVAALAETDDELRDAQYRVPEMWQATYGEGLRIFLPDTFGSAQFFANAPDWLKHWRGQRQDSGDPKREGERYADWLRARGVDPAERVTIYSDGLDLGPILDIAQHFGALHQSAFGWGTLLTNDFAGTDTGNAKLRNISMVCKVVAANGRPCVKLSNNPNKATGPEPEVARYQRIFGVADHVAQAVVV